MAGSVADIFVRTTSADVPAQVVVADDVARLADIWPRSTGGGAARRFVFQCADILEVWVDTIGKGSGIKPCFVALLDAAGAPQLLLPLGLAQRHGVRTIAFLDGGVADFNAPVVFPGAATWDEARMRSAWRAISRALPAHDVAVFEKMPQAVEDMPNPLRFLKSGVETDGVYRVTLPRDWDAGARALVPNLGDSRRKIRKLEKLGRLQFRIAGDEAEAQGFLEAMIEMKRAQFMRTLGYDLFSRRQGFADYYAEATKRLRAGGTVQLSAVLLNDEILAAHWGCVVGNRFYQLMPAFRNEAEWRPYAPGRLLNEFLMEWSSREGLEIFDFGYGDEPYKAAYAQTHEELFDAVLPATAVGQVYAAARASMRLAKATVKRTSLGEAMKRLRFEMRRWRGS